MVQRASVRVVGLLVLAALVGSISHAPAADAEPTFVRQQGLDRYGTAAAVSSVAFSPGVPVAFVASGETFPDALAGAPAAAALGGPVLLVQRNALPNATVGELDRLDPERIVVLGGTSAVSQAVAQALVPFAATGVFRIEGADRYATAAEISEAFFLTADRVFVATGQAFADALTGGAGIAGTTGGPLLLVLRDSIPAATAAELQRLQPADIVVLGGESAVSAAVFAQLDQYATDPVQRKAGADRYGTGVAVSSLFAAAPKVYLATGEAFPDALAGGAAAGFNDSPVLLVRKDCIPAAVDLEISRLMPGQVVVLGGESALGPGVLARQVC
ncbi:MAG TPA: cell wall-binding repeat-containing protein [Acidimicrobiales bacterium]|nr:cell wall-binding repeat-containing protein [Acidimicrobiales bacterium]